MCDTAVALPAATAAGHTIFAKNSDRHPNEAQPLYYAPRQSHAADSTVRCQYLEVPQAPQTWEIVGCRPWWLWGFETGVNERGVAIGNEAVFSKEPYAETGLLGMDLVRLGLERGATATEALRVIVAHLERYGQGGSASVFAARYYDNSFIIADSREAWVLETAGRYWAARRVRGAANISNVYTIETEWDLASPGLVEHAVAQGWCGGSADFNFARAYGDWERPLAPRQFRYQRGAALLARAAGRIDEATMRAYLRDHYEGTFAAPRGTPQELLFPSLCMHGSRQTDSETASGLVATLRAAEAPLGVSLWHCFSQPCLNAFHPLYFGVGSPSEALSRGERAFSADSPWWACERLQRRVDADPRLGPTLRGLWSTLEERWQGEAAGAEAAARRQLAAGDVAGARALLAELQARTSAELLGALRRAGELLDLAAASLGPAQPLQPAYLAALNAEVGLI